MSQQVLLATTNAAKVAKLRMLLDGLPGLQLVSPSESPPIEEGQRSLRDAAIRKARAWARMSGLPAIATDGGLSVPALGRRWRPVLTRRAAGESATAEEHAVDLLARMRDVRGDQRRAYQYEVIAVAAADGRLVGAWSARGPRRVVADEYQPSGLEPGFWVPGVLEPLPDAVAADLHWLRLRSPLRRAVRTLLVGRPDPGAAEPPCSARRR